MNEKYIVYGAGGLVLLLVLAKVSQAKATAGAANQSSLSGLTGGEIASIGTSIGKGLKSLFGSSTGANTGGPTDGSNLNTGALSFLSPDQRVDLGLEEPTGGNTLPSGDFFGPDINPSTGAYTG